MFRARRLMHATLFSGFGLGLCLALTGCGSPSQSAVEPLTEERKAQIAAHFKDEQKKIARNARPELTPAQALRGHRGK